MTRQGTVTKIDGATVFIASRPLECCSGGESCHCLQTGKTVTFRARTDGTFPVQVGDFVEAGTERGQMGKGILKVFALPLGGFIAGITVLGLLGLPPPYPLSAGFGAAGIGFIAAWFLFKPKQENLPRLIRVIPTLDLVPRTPQSPPVR